jgi:hypothetical protein
MSVPWVDIQVYNVMSYKVVYSESRKQIEREDLYMLFIMNR